MEPILRGEGLHKEFGSAARRVGVLTDAGIVVHRGELVAIAGSSGSGKSTLLHILGGIMHPDRGHVVLGGTDVYGLDDRGRAGLRNRRVGFVFQFHHLLPEFTALENVMLPGLIRGDGAASLRDRARRLLERLGLAARASHRPGELSGGEQQRVAVARALINEPQVLLADEPSGNLDEVASSRLHDLLDDLARDGALGIVVATHSPALAQRARRAYVLHGGNLQAPGEVPGWA